MRTGTITTQPVIVRAVSHVRPMRGGAQSHLLNGDDGHSYVTKSTNNPQHRRVLANEMFATRLLKLLRLPVPEPMIVDVTQDFIESTPSAKIQFSNHSKPLDSGLSFGSRFVDYPFIYDYLPEAALSHVRNLTDFARILVFDKWTFNADGRQAIFTRKLHGRKYDAVFIDHGYCFNAGEWSFPDSPLRGVYARNEVYEHVTGWDAFEPTLGILANLSEQQIADCASNIPFDWFGDNADLARLVLSLYRRRTMVASLIEGFKDSCRNPFPNWPN